MTSTCRSRRGRAYRRCGCRGADGRQLGSRCPALTSRGRHGSWAYAVDLPSLDRQRRTRRRSGFPTQAAATAALEAFLTGERTGIYADPDLLLGTYLADWLAGVEDRLKPGTFARYRGYVRQDLTPGLGHLRLSDLRRYHVQEWARRQQASGRGRITLYRSVATLSSALGSAMRAGMIPCNPAARILPRPTCPERLCWSPPQAAAFLRHNHRHHADQLTDLFEVLIGTGLRRGEALALHWDDVHLPDHALFVRWTLSSQDNTHVHLTRPKTKASRARVSLSPHVLATLARQAERQRAHLPTGAPLTGFVFAHPDGSPSPHNAFSKPFTLAPRTPGSPASGCTTSATPQPPSCSPQASHSSPSPRPCATPHWPPPLTSTATS